MMAIRQLAPATSVVASGTMTSLLVMAVVQVTMVAVTDTRNQSLCDMPRNLMPRKVTDFFEPLFEFEFIQFLSMCGCKMSALCDLIQSYSKARKSQFTL